MTLPRHLTSATAEHFLERLGRVRADSPRHWGTMVPLGMMAHLTRIFEMSLGEFQAEDISNPLTRSRIVQYIVIEWLPIPKGRLKAPPYLTPPPSRGFDEEVERARAAVLRFARKADEAPDAFGFSPLFGPLTFRQWSRLHARHTDHHLRQFGA